MVVDSPFMEMVSDIISWVFKIYNNDLEGKLCQFDLSVLIKTVRVI